VEPSDTVGNIWAEAAALLPSQILVAYKAPASRLWRYNLCSKFSSHMDLMVQASDLVQHLDSLVVYSIYLVYTREGAWCNSKAPYTRLYRVCTGLLCMSSLL